MTLLERIEFEKAETEEANEKKVSKSPPLSLKVGLKLKLGKIMPQVYGKNKEERPCTPGTPSAITPVGKGTNLDEDFFEFPMTSQSSAPMGKHSSVPVCNGVKMSLEPIEDEDEPMQNVRCLSKIGILHL